MNYDIVVTDQNGVSTIHSRYLSSALDLWYHVANIIAKEGIICTGVKVTKAVSL